jgi:dienelactone hydrolase
MRVDVEFPSGEETCRGWLYLPGGTSRMPLVVMAHGLGAVKEMRLDAYAERFVDAGYACLVFDYRHFGASAGEPRQLLSVARQLEDWRAAIAYARSRRDVDPHRVAIWGSSFGGGHVLATAATVPVAAAIAQCPFTDGVASTLAVGVPTIGRVLLLACRDAVAAARRTEPVLIPLVGEPGTTALMTAPDVMAGFLALMPAGLEFRNAVTARVAFDILRYRPGRAARGVSCPLHVTVCDHDSVAPARATVRHVSKARRVEILRRPVGHFDVYQGDEFEAVVAEQVAFLRRHVPSAP